jgi:hypothetical protein
VHKRESKIQNQPPRGRFFSSLKNFLLLFSCYSCECLSLNIYERWQEFNAKTTNKGGKKMAENQFNMWQAMAAHQKATGIKSFDLTALVVPIETEKSIASEDYPAMQKDTKSE